MQIIQPLALTLVLLSAITGCTRPSTIGLRSGAEIEAVVDHSDDDKLYVVLADDASAASTAGMDEVSPVTDEQSESGEPLHSVRREDVADVSHPGFTGAIIGTVLTTLGVGAIVGGFAYVATCGGDLCWIAHAFATLPGAVVVAGASPLMIWGWTTYGRSSSAEDAPDAVSSVSLAPLVVPVNGKTHVGVAASARW